MATQFVEGQSPRTARESRTAEVIGAGSLVEGLAAAGAVVLAILGLAGANPVLMLDIATIVLGAALLAEGGAIAARYSRLVRRASGSDEIRAELGGGMTAESLAGVAGIVLGILGLLGVMPVALATVALLAFGGGVLLGSAANSRLLALDTGHFGDLESSRGVLREGVYASVGGQVLVGIGAVVLGIIALVGYYPIMLTLVGILAVGAALMLTGSAAGAKVLGLMRHGVH